MIIEKKGEFGFLQAARIILSKNKNNPMSANEIWDEIVSDNLSSKLTYKDTRPADSLYYMLMKSSINSELKTQYRNKEFEIVGDNPKKFKITETDSRIIKPIEFGIGMKKEEPVGKMTFAKAAQVILQDNDNKPMSVPEIWKQISERNLVETIGKTPIATLNAKMSYHSDSDSYKNKSKSIIFTIVDTTPVKFKLINPDEIQDIEDDEEVESDIDSSLNIPAVRNPFGGESKEAGDDFDSSALFVVGESGSGKSTRILKVLRQNNHKFILIGSESAPSPNLLFDYDQSEGYIPSDIAEFIISAKKDPKSFYTIIFDECHEYIDEIKRSILHAISTKRGEKRFFGVKKSIRHFFDDLETYETTSKIIPDNVGFIFISSKPDVFEYHADFMGRVDKVIVTREDPYPYPDLKYIQSKIDRQDQL